MSTIERAQAAEPGPEGQVATGPDPRAAAPDERYWIAAHESAHAVAGWLLLGEAPAVISIRHSAAHSGATIREESRWTGERLLPDRLVFDQPTAARDRLEKLIVCALAGRVAEEMLPATGYLPDPTPPPKAERLTMAAGPRAMELLERAEARPSDDELTESDELNALDRALALVGVEEANAYLGWLRVATRRFLSDHWTLVAAVAAALMAHEVMDGPTFVRIVEGGAIRS